MKHYALIGEKLGHSLSVPIHRAVFAALNIDADYQLIEIARDSFAETMAALMPSLDGFNVTIPYKQTIIPLLQGLDEAAQTIGAVNTVTLPTLMGHNTDAPGFVAMLRHHGISPDGQPCYVLGTGGAAKAVVAALDAMGAAKVVQVSRQPHGEQLSYDDLPEVFSGVLVNTTPVGMWPNVDACPLSKDALNRMLPRAVGVADVIYNPADTLLTRYAASFGVPCCTGLYMLVAQAVEAERLWQNHPIPETLISEIMKELTQP